MILLPVNSVDYEDIKKLSDCIANPNSFMKPSELKVGYSYTDKNNLEYVYMGRLSKYQYYRYWCFDEKAEITNVDNIFIHGKLNCGLYYVFIWLKRDNDTCYPSTGIIEWRSVSKKFVSERKVSEEVFNKAKEIILTDKWCQYLKIDFTSYIKTEKEIAPSYRLDDKYRKAIVMGSAEVYDLKLNGKLYDNHLQLLGDLSMTNICTEYVFDINKSELENYWEESYV